MWILNLIVGLVTGVLSGYGIGGGTLLLLWLTMFTGLNQIDAAGINLTYFVCTAIPALIGHFKNKLVDKETAIPCIIAGIPACIIISFVAVNLNVDILRKIFGVFVLIIGIKELFAKSKKDQKNDIPD